jgi:hypothetical protein
MPPARPIGSTKGGTLIEFAPTAAENLPARIAEVAGQLQFQLKVGRRTTILGRSQHVVEKSADSDYEWWTDRHTEFGLSIRGTGGGSHVEILHNTGSD